MVSQELGPVVAPLGVEGATWILDSDKEGGSEGNEITEAEVRKVADLLAVSGKKVRKALFQTDEMKESSTGVLGLDLKAESE